MSCSPFDLRDYYFKDLAENERRLTEVHVKTCAHCREELERLRGTETALLALPDEEIPQRIGFVSDPVFQPSAFRRGWTCSSGLCRAIGFRIRRHALGRLGGFFAHPPRSASRRAGSRHNPSRRAEADVSQRCEPCAVAQAVAESEARQLAQTQELLAASDRRHALETQDMKVRVEEYIEVEKKRQNTLILASNEARRASTGRRDERTGAPAGVLLRRAGGSAAAHPRITRAALAAVEKNFDSRFAGAYTPMPSICWAQRAASTWKAIGAVFSTELNLIVSPNVSPFHQTFTKIEIARIHDRKVRRLPLLKQKMREMLVASAVSLENLPPSEQVVLAVSLFHYSWEDYSGLPGQIVMQAERQKLLSNATRETAIRTVDF